MNSRTQSPRAHHSPMAATFSPHAPIRTPITRIYRASSQNDTSHGHESNPGPGPGPVPSPRQLNLPRAQYPYHRRTAISPSNPSGRILSPPVSPRHEVIQRQPSPRGDHRYYQHPSTSYRTSTSPLNAPLVVLPSDVHNGRSAYALAHHPPTSSRRAQYDSMLDEMERRVHDQRDLNPNLKASIPHKAVYRGTLSPRDARSRTPSRTPRASRIGTTSTNHPLSIGGPLKKVRLIPEAEYAQNQNGSHQTSKSVSSLTRTDSDHSHSKNTEHTTASTSFYTATATTYTGVSSPHRRNGDDAVAPCEGDPFWDYYRTIGNIARANSYELINVMKFISSDHIIKFFLQSWLQARIEPIDLPFANEAIMSKMKYTKRTRKKSKWDKYTRGRKGKRRQKHKSKALRSLTMSAAPKMERIESDRNDQFEKPMDSSTQSLIKQFTMNKGGGYTFDALRLSAPSITSPNGESEDSDAEDDEEEDSTDCDDEEEAFSSTRGGDLFSASGHGTESRANGCYRNGKGGSGNGSGSRGKPFNISSINSSVSSMSTVNTQSTVTIQRYRSHQADSVIYSTKSTNSKMDLSLNHSSLTKFIQQSLSVCDDGAKHPNFFDIPRLCERKHNLREKAIVFMQQDGNRKYRHRVELVEFMHFEHGSHGNSESHTPRRWKSKWNEEMNRIGSTMFSFCDQFTFLSASVVSRSWFYCSRFETARSQIQLRLYNVLRYLTKHKQLLEVITKQNGILSVDELLWNHKMDKIRGLHSGHYDGDSDSDDSDWNHGADDLEAEELRQRDLFISCVSGGNGQESSAEFLGNMLLRNDSKSSAERENMNCRDAPHSNSNINRNERSDSNSSSNSKAFHFPHFFSTRTQCSLYSSVTVLQIDLTILTNNGLMYFVDQTLYDCFWEMAFSLFRIEGLRRIDLILPDPHVVLLSYMLSNIDKINVRKSELKFPSIGIPKNKFLCISKVIRSLSFKCKSLSTTKLCKMLDTHFEHYFHPSHHSQNMEQCDITDSRFVQFVHRQSTALYFKSLDSYQLCRKTIQKPLLYDITHALYYLNRRPCDEVHSVETLILSDVRCASKEFQTFLNHNAKALRTLEITFTECGVLRVVPSLHGHGESRYSNFGKTKRGSNSRSNHGTPSAHSNKSGKTERTERSERSGHSSSHHPNSNDEDTGFPDVAVMHHNSKRPKSSTQKRIIQNINEIFDAVLRYLTISTSKLRDYNSRIRAKRIKERSLTLPLHTLALSFPTTDFGEESLCGFFEIFKVLETSPDEVRLNTLYLNGCMLSRANLRKVNWIKILQSQHLERMYLQQMVYTESFFESACKLWSHSLIHLELSLLFDTDPRNTPSRSSSSSKKGHKSIKRLFLLLEKCHKLETVALDFGQKPSVSTQYMQQYSPYQHGQSGYDSRSSSSAQRRRSSIFGGTQLPQLPQSLPQVDHSPSLSAVSNTHDSPSTTPLSSSGDYHLMEPVLDIWWIHKFMVSQNIKRSIRSLRLTFNELSTARFESHRHGAATSKYMRYNQAHGQILRVSEGFTREVEQLIMSWFSKCETLTETKMVRRLSTMDTFDALNRTPYSTAMKDTTADDREVDFDGDISVFDSTDDRRDGEVLEENENRDLVRFEVTKWKVGDVYKGGVEGDLGMLLMPEIPIG